MALKNKIVKLMKSKLLLIGSVLWLGSATGLAQFPEFLLSAGLTPSVDNSYTYILNLSVSGSQDSDVIGSTFTMGIWDWAATISGDPVPPAPEFLGAKDGWVSPGITDTPFASVNGQYSILFTDTMPENALYSELTVQITVPKVGDTQPVVTLPFTQGEQRLLGVTIIIPPDLKPGSWRLYFPDTGWNSLSVPTEDPEKPAALSFANVVPGNFDYILRYNGTDLTLEVPEPSQFAVVGGLALLGFAGWRRSRN